MKDEDGNGLFIGLGTLKKGTRVGGKFVYGPNSPHPKHLKESLHQLLHLLVTHPQDDITDDDSIMVKMWGTARRNELVLSKSNQITTVNKKFVEMFIQQVAVNFYMDDYRRISMAPAPWKSGTDIRTRNGIQHNIEVIVCFLYEHNPVLALRYLPTRGRTLESEVWDIFAQSHTFKNKLKKGVVSTHESMKRLGGKAIYMHQFFLAQCVLQEAECTSFHNVATEWNIHDRSTWITCIGSTGSNSYGTCLRWKGVELDEGEIRVISLQTKGSAEGIGK